MASIQFPLPLLISTAQKLGKLKCNMAALTRIMHYQKVTLKASVYLRSLTLLCVQQYLSATSYLVYMPIGVYM